MNCILVLSDKLHSNNGGINNDNQYPHYLNEDFLKAPESSSSLRNSYQKLQQPFRKTNTGQNALSFIGPALWNKVPEEMKRTTKLNAFKHNLKKHYLKEIIVINIISMIMLLHGYYCYYYHYCWHYYYFYHC